MDAINIAKFLKSNLIGNNMNIKNISSLFNIKANSLLFLNYYDEKLVNIVNDSEYELLVLCDSSYAEELRKSHIIVENPKFSFANVLYEFYVDHPSYKVDETAIIDKTCVIGAKATIKKNVIIEEKVEIGTNCYIEENVIIRKGTIVGNNCVIKANTVIGGEGFGFVIENNIPYRIPHLGNVVISDNCEIGENSSVNRGTIDNTVIKENVKISSYVKIAHNVLILKNTMIATGSQISGSCNIGEKVWIGTNSTVSNKIKIGEGAIIGAGSTVVQDIKENSIVKGNPAK